MGKDDHYVILMGGLHIEMAMLKLICDRLDGSGWTYVIVIYVATTVTITTLVILAAGPKREYPDGGVNKGSTNNKCHKQNGLRTLIHWFEHVHNNWRRGWD